MWVRACVALALVVVLSSACGEAGNDHSASPPAAADASDPWTDSTRWTVRELWRVGGAAAAAEYAFSDQALALGLSGHGHVFVADPGNHISAYEAGQGRFVRHLGQKGEGPGEWLHPLGVGLGPDGSVWVSDLYRRRYLLFDTAGVFVDGFDRHAEGLPRLARPLTFDTLGLLIEEGSVDLTPGPMETRRDVLFSLVRPGGEVMDSLPPLQMHPFRRRPGRVRAQTGPPRLIATPRLIYTVTPTEILFAFSNRLLIHRRSLDGDTLPSFGSAHRSEMPMTRSERDELRESMRVEHLDGEAATYRPIVQSLHALSDGHVLVQIEDRLQEPGRRFDVFAPTGAFLGTLDMGFTVDPTSPMVSRGDTLFVVGYDEMEAKSLSRVVIDRPVPR